MNTSLTISTLHQLLDYDACKFTRAEVQLKNNLPEWIKRSGSVQLKIIMQQYLTFVEQHVRKMESFFEQEKINSISLPNRVMMAFTTETNDVVSRCTTVEVHDACLLASLQAINHFKISIYGTAAAFASTLGMEKAAAVFYEAETNEKYIDGELSQLAEHELNMKAKIPIIVAR